MVCCCHINFLGYWLILEVFTKLFSKLALNKLSLRKYQIQESFFFPYASTAHFNTDTTVISTQKGFPKDSSLDQLEEFFASYGKVRSWDLY